MIECSPGTDACILRLVPDSGRFNILNAATIRRIKAAFEQAAGHDAPVIRVRGEGGSFAVGANIKTMLEFSARDAVRFSTLGHSLFSLMRAMDKVIIAEIDGFCMGGGMDFAAACDIRVATAHSSFAHPGSRLGIITGFGGTQTFPRMLRPAAASQLLFVGERMSAGELHGGGFLSRVFDEAAGMDRWAGELAKNIASRPKGAAGMLKRMAANQ